MTSIEELEQLMKVSVDPARINLAIAGELVPVWIAQSKSGKVSIFATPWDGDEEKDAICSALKNTFRILEIVRYVFVSEVWFMELEKNGAITQRPSLSPRRKEAVLFSAEDDEGNQISEMRPIIRQPGKRPILGKPQRNAAGLSTGRMVNMLSYRGAKQ